METPLDTAARQRPYKSISYIPWYRQSVKGACRFPGAGRWRLTVASRWGLRATLLRAPLPSSPPVMECQCGRSARTRRYTPQEFIYGHLTYITPFLDRRIILLPLPRDSHGWTAFIRSRHWVPGSMRQTPSMEGRATWASRLHRAHVRAPLPSLPLAQ